MQITPAQRTQFDEDGFFITPKVFDDAILARIRKEVDRLRLEKLDQIAKHDASRVDQAATLTFLTQMHRYSPLMRDFYRHPVFAGLCREMIGADADQVWNQAMIKPPVRGRVLPWHQDAQYAITEPLDPGFTCWIAITRATIENGTLWVIPGMHKRGLLPHEWIEQVQEWECRPDESRKMPAVIDAGQMLIFTRLTPHTSGPNVSNETRIALQVGFAPPGWRLKETGEPFGDQMPVLRSGAVVSA